MVYWGELQARIQDFFRFSRLEMIGLLAAVIVTGFIFSFQDWGTEQFDAAVGLHNLLLMTLAAAIGLFFRSSCQKVYALSEGYKAEFKVWWAGLAIALVVIFISAGRIPLIFAGTMVASFMVKQRLGEFRYGFSYWNNAMIAYWGILGNLILAILFAIGSFAWPQSYFLSKGLALNLIMAFTSLLPLPQLDGLSIFFGSRKVYVLAIVLSILAAVLLIPKTTFGLIFAVVVGLVYALIYLLIGSEK